MVVLEIFKDQTLLSRLRNSLRGAIKLTPELSFNMKAIEENPLLLSVYSESMRRLLTVYITRCAPEYDLKINTWLLPRDKVMMVNTYPAHMDAEVWNTNNGAYPLNTFWAERFLVYPNDPTSGPLRKDLHDPLAAPSERKDDENIEEPRFSLDGLNGSFIPFGGEFSHLYPSLAPNSIDKEP